METKEKRKIRWARPIALLTPVVLIGLFGWLKNDRAVMDSWVFRVMAPVERFLGRLWSVVPISMMEVLIALFLVGNVVWMVRAVVLVYRDRAWKGLFRRLLALAAAWLWLWAGVDWLWNGAYYATGFAQREGLKTEPYSVEQLAAVTEQFAQNAARLSGQMERDREGHFAEDLKGCFDRGVSIYENLEREFSSLSIKSVEAKPMICSRLQSMLGFTGMYFPFTGEANVNVDQPACLVPATIGHEMAHQCMVASELEANFVGIAACVTSEDPVFQYSGYMMGLINLCNALYPVDAETWYAIVQENFTEELTTDWRDNNEYWAALSSPVEDAAGEVYDSFLKRNDQELGMRSYGACVDLLVAYFGET